MYSRSISLVKFYCTQIPVSHAVARRVLISNSMDSRNVLCSFVIAGESYPANYLLVISGIGLYFKTHWR